MDDTVARWMAGHRTGVLDDIALGLAWANGLLGALAVVGVVAACAAVWFGGWRPIVRVAGVLAAVTLLTVWLKPVIDRPRPPADLALTQAPGSAMPSTNALITSAIVVAVAMGDWWASERLRRLVVTLGVVGCLAVGAAMIYLGVHWLTDVLVGWALGTGLTWVLMRVSEP